MAIGVTGSTGRLGRTTNLMDHEGAYTYMLWARWLGTVGQRYILTVVHEGSPSYDLFGSNSSNQLWLRSYFSTDGDATGTTLSADTWYHIALVRESVTSLKVYLDGVLDITGTLNVTGRSLPDRLDVSGYASGAGSRFEGYLAAFKSWSVALNSTEVAAEKDYEAPVRTSNVHAYTTLATTSDVNDLSGNGYNWTVDGTITTETGPSFASSSPRRLLALTGVG
jgi:hypothetical protein